MNTTSTQNRPQTRGQQQRSVQQQNQSQRLSLENIRQRLEDHVRSNPIKAVGQAVAAGYILRFLPIRFMISTAMRLAPPLMLANRLWQGGALSSQQKEE
jgi:hypothetical protein